MIGRYYDTWGTKQSILHRYGDNRGDPFFGPVQLTYQSNLRFFVLQKNQVISLQNTFGGIECHICSLEDQEKLEDAILDAEIQAELTNIYSSSSKKDNHTAPPNKLYTVYLDINPIYISCIFNTNSLFILDSRNLIKVYDIEQRTIRRTFGKTGLEVGEFNNVTCIHAFRIGSQSFVLVGDSGANQRVNLFTADGEFLCSIGSKGPMIGQFRDITSISTCIPSDLQDPNTDFYYKEYIPSWYKGGNSNYTEDELQDFLVADDQMNNFVIGKDKKSKEENAYIVHYVNRDKTMSKLPIKYGEVIMRVKLPITTTTNNTTTTTNPSKTPPKPTTRSSVTSFPTSTTKFFMKPPATKTTTESENNNNNLKKKESLVLKQSIEETIIRKTGFHLIEPERFDDGGEPLQVYNSLYESIKHRKDYFLLQEEKRDSFLTAVCDRKNFRIQILRGFWTKSLIYSPFFIPIDVIGGSKNRYCALQDPIDVCYSNTGKELIISDNGKNQILLLSSTVLEVIKVIQPMYLSSRDLQLDTDNDNSNNDQQQQPGEQLVNSKIKNIEQSISIVDEINKQFIASIDIPDVPLEKKENDNDNNTARTRASFSSNKGVGKKKDSKFTDLEIENMKKPCSISFNQHGNMLVGFKSGGIYVYQKNRNSPMGMLEKLQIKSMEKIILEYLTYQDIEILRNTCVYLHNFTRELRLTYRIFPSYRQKQYNKLIYLFFNYSRVGKEGLPQLSNIELKDKYNCKICPYYLQLLCPLNELTCNYSHNIIYIHRKEINETNAYICYNELIYFISQIFHPKFIWQNEIYIKELFHAFSYEENIVIRQGALNRPGDPFREKVPQTTRVINFLSYLEIMVLLEEHMNKYKSLSAHKLFCPTAVKRFIPKVPTSIESVENVVPYSNPLIQYDKGGINIPPNRHLQGKRIISKKGYENVERKEDDKRKEHVAVFQYHTERVAALIDQLFT